MPSIASFSRIAFSAACVSFIALASCKTTASFPPQATNVDRICKAVCSGRARCGEKVDDHACRATCADKGTKWRPYWREDYVAAVDTCFATASCDALKTTKDRETTCFASTRPPPSEKAVTFARLAVSQDNACGVYYDHPLSVEQLLRTYGALEDSVLAPMIECQERGCKGHDTRWSCVFDLVGIDNKD